MATLLDEFKAISLALNNAGIEYAVCGGWAMAIHGLPRATMDIDLLVLADDFEAAWSIAKKFGYDIEGLPLHFDPVEIRRISKLAGEPKQIYTLDFLLVTDQLLPIWREREMIEWSEGKTPVVSRNGLIKLKEISGRDRDLIDIKQLREEFDES